VNGSAALRTLVLAAWAAFFVVLWTTGEGERYLGPRTQWVIPFGALALGATAAAQGLVALGRRRRTDGRWDTPPSAHEAEGSFRFLRGEGVGSLVLALPILALLVVPTPELGAQAVSKKRASNAVLVAQLPDSSPRKSSLDAPFLDVAVATLSPREGAALGLAAGAPVRVHGLVVDESDAPGTFGLTRFFISCCAADALPIVVPVAPGGAARPAENDWAVVTGRLARRGSQLVVAAEGIRRTAPPSSPYVSSSDAGASPAVSPAPAGAESTSRRSGEAAGFAGRAARVYERYFAHCKVYTYDALAWPEKARNDEEAARLFAGPPRRYQRPAFRGCLDGLRTGEARITLAELFRRIARSGEG
jgi:putative membrane protein